MLNSISKARISQVLFSRFVRAPWTLFVLPVALVCLLQLGCKPTANMTGIVVNSVDGTPVVGAKVVAKTESDLVEHKPFLQIETTTGADGSYLIKSGLAAKDYAIEVSMDGWSDNRILAQTPGFKETRQLDKMDIAQLPTIVGNVINAITKKPAAGCSVKRGEKAVVTDESGSFRMERVPVYDGNIHVECGEAYGSCDVEMSRSTTEFRCADIPVLKVQPSELRVWTIHEDYLAALTNAFLPYTGNYNGYVQSETPELNLHLTLRYELNRHYIAERSGDASVIKRGQKVVYRGGTVLSGFPIVHHEARRWPPHFMDGSGPVPEIREGFYAYIDEFIERQSTYSDGRVWKRMVYAHLRRNFLEGEQLLSNDDSLYAATMDWPKGLYCLDIALKRDKGRNGGCVMVKVVD